jgi:DNA-binding CsgD family transcriptional regulator
VASDLPKLTPRERELLLRVADGYTAKEISEALGITVRTAETYMDTIINKLRARNRTHAVTLALRQKLIE